jgi:hypothetical protein
MAFCIPNILQNHETGKFIYNEDDLNAIYKNLFTGGCMRFSSGLGIILALACLQGAVAQADLDTLWLCRDSIPDGSAAQLWFKMYLADTFPDNRGKFEMVDTGDSQDGSKYVNFDYQFSNDSVFIKGTDPNTGADTIYHCAPRPGYAGFKFYWDNGFVRYFAETHDSMFFWHKGPLPGHKVQMIWGQGGDCGGPINYQNFGEFKSSSVWTRESFPIPPSPGFEAHGLFELRMLIYNDTGDSPTSAPGCLKIDNMAFIKKSAGISKTTFATKAIGGSRYFIPKVSGKVTLTIYSLQGEQLFKEPIDVTAGKKYNVNQFARKNSNLPSTWIHCVQISGSGVNITRMMVR